MRLFVGLEQDNVERMQEVGGMGGKTEWYNFVLVTVLNKLNHTMGTIAIEKKKAIFALLSLC
jgi:hypothetical protein